MDDKTKIILIKRTREQLDELVDRRKAIDAVLLATDEGQERKKLNSEIKNLSIALNDMEYGTGYFDSAQMTIEDYLANRPEGTPEHADHVGDDEMTDDGIPDPPKPKK